MKSKDFLHVALAVMCAVAFSVCVDSCDKNDINKSNDENSLSFVVDTNGVSLAIRPMINWDATSAELDEFMTRNYPDMEILEGEKLYYDSLCDCWRSTYSNNNLNIDFLFGDEQGNDCKMMAFHLDVTGDIEKIREELVRAGLKYKGLVYYDDYPVDMTYLYLSADEQLEVQLYTNNDGGEGYWGISFQPTDKDDFNSIIDETDFSIDIKADEGTYSLHPLLDWDATLTDIRRYMSENYPDWEAKEGGGMIKDSTDDEEYWYVKYAKDSMVVCFYFNDENGDVYDLLQYVYYSSTDISQVQSELTRNGIVYIDVEDLWDPDEISALGYAPLSKDYYVSLETWNIHGGCWCLNISSYDE